MAEGEFTGGEVTTETVIGRVEEGVVEMFGGIGTEALLCVDVRDRVCG